MLLKEAVTGRLLSPTVGQAREKHMPHSHFTPQHTLCHCTQAKHTEQETNAAFSSLTKCNLDPNPPNFLWDLLCLQLIGDKVQGGGKAAPQVSFFMTSYSRRRRRSVISSTFEDYKDLALASGGQAIQVSKSQLSQATDVILDTSTSALVRH